MRNQVWIRAVKSCGVLFTISFLFAACGGRGSDLGSGGGGSTSDTTRATIGISGSLGTSDLAADSGFLTRIVASEAVDSDTIASLVITVTKITLHHAGGDDEEEEGGEETEESQSDEDGTGPGWIVVYEYSDGMDVDLVELDGTSSIVDTTDLPSGKYTKMVIDYENPRMTLVGDEKNELDNILVTANGRLFVSQNFTLGEGGATLILIDFGGVHLSYQPGPDRYTLTPQLRVVIELGSAEVEIDGIITDLGDDTMYIQLDNSVEVFAMDDTLITRQIMDGPATDTLRSGTALDVEVIEIIDLMINDAVEVEGVAEQDGSIIADTIEVQLPEVEVLP